MEKEMQEVFSDLTDDNKGMVLLLGQAIKLAQEDKTNEKVKENV